MTSKPSTSDGYGDVQVGLVHQTCLYMATKLGDHDGPGPVAAARFMAHELDDNIQADVVGHARELLRYMGRL